MLSTERAMELSTFSLLESAFESKIWTSVPSMLPGTTMPPVSVILVVVGSKFRVFWKVIDVNVIVFMRTVSSKVSVRTPVLRSREKFESIGGVSSWRCSKAMRALLLGMVSRGSPTISKTVAFVADR